MAPLIPSTPSLLATQQPHAPRVTHPSTSLHSHPKTSSASSAKPWPAYRRSGWVLIRLKLSKFLSLDFPRWNGKGQMSRDALRRDFLQALLSFVLCCPFLGSTYRSIRLPVDAFCSARLIQLPEEMSCLVSLHHVDLTSSGVQGCYK